MYEWFTKSDISEFRRVSLSLPLEQRPTFWNSIRKDIDLRDTDKARVIFVNTLKQWTSIRGCQVAEEVFILQDGFI